MRINRRGTVGATLLTAFLLSQSGVAAAQAEEVELAFTEPTAVTIEYGQPWEFPVTSGGYFYDYMYTPNRYEIHTTGATGFVPALYMYSTGSDMIGSTGGAGILAIPNDVPALVPGSYTFVIECQFLEYHAETPTPARLTVQKAQLGIDLRVLADPINPDAAIVTAKFSGRFADEYQSSFYGSAAISPAGEWHITLKDEQGAVAIERNIERSAGDDVMATSFYWADAEPDTEYSATAEFVPSGASAANFTVAPSSTVSFTAAAEQRPVPSSSATVEPTSVLPEPAGFGLPLWALFVVILLTLALGALVTVLSIRLRKGVATP